MDYVNGENSPFSNASFTLGQYRGHYYGMPETLSWSALFYRTDIMEELGINPEELNTCLLYTSRCV